MKALMTDTGCGWHGRDLRGPSAFTNASTSSATTTATFAVVDAVLVLLSSFDGFEFLTIFGNENFDLLSLCADYERHMNLLN